MEIIKVKLTELKPYGKNPRKNDEAAKEVAKSIEQCGYVAPIIVDENMEILAGHTRLKATHVTQICRGRLFSQERAVRGTETKIQAPG